MISRLNVCGFVLHFEEFQDVFTQSLFHSEPNYGRPSDNAGILVFNCTFVSHVISTPQILCENVLGLMLSRDLSLLQTNPLVQHTVWLQNTCVPIFNLHN